ncbi:uncharacterized protein [Symphalangus syndactylus]|uniref:uncharacterized protein isoform X2 n=1 Tax=Symphalangus syndactylus TaxID=9590 RepID=UPI003006AD84
MSRSWIRRCLTRGHYQQQQHGGDKPEILMDHGHQQERERNLKSKWADKTNTHKAESGTRAVSDATVTQEDHSDSEWPSKGNFSSFEKSDSSIKGQNLLQMRATHTSCKSEYFLKASILIGMTLSGDCFMQRSLFCNQVL